MCTKFNIDTNSAVTTTYSTQNSFVDEMDISSPATNKTETKDVVMREASDDMNNKASTPVISTPNATSNNNTPNSGKYASQASNNY